MQSKAATVSQYLAELPEDRRAALQAVRQVILKNLDKNYSEKMQYGMIGYCVPHSVYPAGYHCDPREPLPFAGLASQKHYMSLYLGSVYCGCEGGEPTDHALWFRQAWIASGKKLDMGKTCIRFRKLEDVPLDVVGEAIRRVPTKTFLEFYENAMQMIKNRPREARGGRARAAARKPAAKARAGAKRATAAASRKAAPSKRR